MDKGLYESLLTVELQERLARLPDLASEVAAVDPAEQPGVLSQYLSSIIHDALSSTKSPEGRSALVVGILDQVRQFRDGVESPLLDEKSNSQQLLQVYRPGIIASGGASTLRPATPLSAASLLTNARGEPTLATELRAEIASADRVDLLCAFVKWYGLRLLEDQSRELKNRGVPVRVLTTTYMGATDAKALDALVKEFGAEVRINYETNRTRLHAKAWMFERNSGFDTAYVGSSNLSRAALVDGLEWNVRLSSVSTPDLLDKFRSTFESYWQDKEFIPYDPDEQGQLLRDALAQAGSSPGSSQSRLTLSGLQVRPLPHQQEMLEQIDAERKLHDRHRNLVVAATGTGKTVIAALDYRRLVEEGNRDLSLLFVAHRIEILEQAQRTYREVLSDGSFGEILASGKVPQRGRHVFASVMSLTAEKLDLIQPDDFDVVVIDEFHHAQASTYRRTLDHLQPAELLGLTATPERSDGVNVSSFFGGRIASELRLWDALDQNLLVPFHYFGIDDQTDLEQIAWRRGAGYDTNELTDLYIANVARLRIILSEVQAKVLDPRTMKCLGFCVSVKHARYMAERFEEAGIPAVALDGTSPDEERRNARKALRRGEINAIFTVDLYNEGVDIPEVDTVLFLRPTESATVFLQQLGRGLRMSESKSVLTALDFVGHQRKEFRFDQRFKALTGHSGKALEQQVKEGFPMLPPGSQIVLDRVAQENLLESLKQQVSPRWASLVAEVRDLRPASLREYLDSGRDLADVLKKGAKDRSWSALQREADPTLPPLSAIESTLLRRIRALAHVDDRERAREYPRLANESRNDLTLRESRLASMLFFSFYPTGGAFSSVEAGLESLEAVPAVRRDLGEVVDVSFDIARRSTEDLVHYGKVFADVPLSVHASYQREEILAAVGHASLQKPPSNFREGVAWCEAINSDVLFVTCKKSAKDFSPSTMYKDFALTPELFHWESQSTTAEASPTGQRYIHHEERGSNVLLFVRTVQDGELGTAPYVFLGPIEYVSHQHSRPMAVTWHLKTPMPTDLYMATRMVNV